MNESGRACLEQGGGAPPTLREWQRRVAALCEGKDPIGVEANGSIREYLPEPDSDDRLEIYRNNYMGTRLQVLEQIFPRLIKLLGKNYMRQCGRRYLLSDQFSDLDGCADLNRLGDGFSRFLSYLLPLKDELSGYPWLADLALLDCYFHQSYYAGDDPVFNFERLQQFNECLDGIQFTLSQSLYVVDSQWPLADINTDIKQGQVRDVYPELKQSICIHRRHFTVGVQVLSRQEGELLKGLSNGLTMKTVLEEIEGSEQNLPVFIQRGWICDFSITPSTDKR